MDDDVKKKIIVVNLMIIEIASEYSIAGRIIYDDCERGVVNKHELPAVILKIR